MRNLTQHANAVAGAGRGPDSTLVHMSPEEVSSLNQIAMQAGLGSLPQNPETGMYEAGFLGDLLKTVGSIGVGALGTAFGGPLGGALASGLFTGLTEKNVKKGLFAGIGSFMLGRGLDAAVRSGASDAASTIGAEAATGAADAAALTDPLFGDIASGGGIGIRGAEGLMPEVPEFGGFQLGNAAAVTPDMPRGLGYFGALKNAGLSGAGEGFDHMMSGPLAYTALPAMRSLEMSWQDDERGGSSYEEMLERERELFRDKFGVENPYYNIYGNMSPYGSSSYAQRYVGGGRISERAAGGVGPGMDFNRFAQGGEIRGGIRRFQAGGWEDDYGYGEPYGGIYGDVTSPHDDYNQYGQPTRDAEGNWIDYDPNTGQPRTAQPRDGWQPTGSHLFPNEIPGASQFSPGFMPEYSYFNSREWNPNADQPYGPAVPFGTGNNDAYGDQGGYGDGKRPGERPLRRGETPPGGPPPEMVGINPFTMDLGSQFEGANMDQFLGGFQPGGNPFMEQFGVEPLPGGSGPPVPRDPTRDRPAIQPPQRDREPIITDQGRRRPPRPTLVPQDNMPILRSDAAPVRSGGKQTYERYNGDMMFADGGAVSDKISTLVGEGMPQRQAVAAAHNMVGKGYNMGGGIMRYAMGGMPNAHYYMGGPVGYMMGGMPESVPGPYQGAGAMAPYVEGGMVGGNGGMSDSVSGMISDTGEPVLVSPGEYIVPADVVSMIGDGNSEAGSDVLEDMIASIRVHKTGAPEQLPQMDPSLLPV